MLKRGPSFSGPEVRPGGPSQSEVSVKCVRRGKRSKRSEGELLGLVEEEVRQGTPSPTSFEREQACEDREGGDSQGQSSPQRQQPQSGDKEVEGTNLIDR